LFGDSIVLSKSARYLCLFLCLLYQFGVQSYAQKAPPFKLKGDSSTINSASYKGKVIYLDYWASWCVPCRKSFPFMNKMHTQYNKAGLEVIGINLDSNIADAYKFLKKTPAKFTIAYDPDGITPETYKVSVMPTSFLIDKNGNIIVSHRGFKETDKNQLEEKIKQALAQR
jgi:cytochrome c biogenesis protein CcmG, thiol:disulfide interchange protein DsbE